MHAKEAAEIANQARTDMTVSIMKLTQEEIIKAARNGAKKITVMTSGPDMSRVLSLHFDGLGYETWPKDYSLEINWE